MEVAIIAGQDAEEIRAEVAAYLRQQYLDHIMLYGDGPGVRINGVFSVDDVKAIEWTDRLKPVDSRNTLKGTKENLPTFFANLEIV